MPSALRQALVVGHSLGARNALVAGARSPGQDLRRRGHRLHPVHRARRCSMRWRRASRVEIAVFSSHAEVRRYLGRRYPLLPRGGDSAPRRVRLCSAIPTARSRRIADAVRDGTDVRGTARRAGAGGAGAWGPLPPGKGSGEQTGFRSRLREDGGAAARFLRRWWSRALITTCTRKRPELIAQAVEGFASQSPGVRAAPCARLIEEAAEDGGQKESNGRPPSWSRGAGEGTLKVALPAQVIERLEIAQGDVLSFTAFAGGWNRGVVDQEEPVCLARRCRPRRRRPSKTNDH